MIRYVIYIFLILVAAYLGYNYHLQQKAFDKVPWGFKANDLRASLNVPLIDSVMMSHDSFMWEISDNEPSDNIAIHIGKSIVPSEQTILNYEMDAFRIRNIHGRVQQLNVYSTITGDSIVSRDGSLFYTSPPIQQQKLDDYGIDSIAKLWKLDGLVRNHAKQPVGKPNYSFINKLREEGFGTDTNRLNQLEKYAYSSLRKSPFIMDGNAMVTYLDIKENSVLASQALDNETALSINSLANGKGFYFVKVDSNGIGLKNSFDFGMEIWECKEIDTSVLLSSWEKSYHPMPVYIELLDNHLYVFYTRQSADYQHLIEMKDNIIKWIISNS